MVDKRVPETEKLGTVLHKHLEQQEDAALQEKMQYYQSCGLAGVKIFLKAEECAGNKYYELDASEPLKENLRNKTIIEYPTLYVAFKEHSSVFTLVDEGKILPSDTMLV